METYGPPSADELIRISHGPLGDFKMPVCCQLIRQCGMNGNFDVVGVDSVLTRYARHTDFWGAFIQPTVVERELQDFSQTAGVSLPEIRGRFYCKRICMSKAREWRTRFDNRYLFEQWVREGGHIGIMQDVVNNSNLVPELCIYSPLVGEVAAALLSIFGLPIAADVVNIVSAGIQLACRS